MGPVATPVQRSPDAVASSADRLGCLLVGLFAGARRLWPALTSLPLGNAPLSRGLVFLGVDGPHLDVPNSQSLA